MATLTWPDLLTQLIAGRDLDEEQTLWATGEILSGNATPVQVAGFAVALRAKGETVAEIDGFVDAMYRHAQPLTIPGRLLDVVGTGGDRSFSVNISTMAAIVAAGAGARVVKHGNRSASSKAGTADVLECLGVRLDLDPAAVARVAQEAGITFCFAQAFHPSLRHAAAARSGLGVATTFNLLGPLTNPAHAQARAVGCADLAAAPLIAGVLARRGVEAWVFRGDDGLDELTTTTTSRVWEVAGGVVSEHLLDPADLGVSLSRAEDLRGGDAAHNAAVVREVLAGARGPIRDAVLVNAGAALAVYEPATGELAERVRSGMARAAAAIDSGAATTTLQRWIDAASSGVAASS